MVYYTPMLSQALMGIYYNIEWCYCYFLLQERTSEESKESESFKGLLHARTQEFIDEV